MIDEPPETHEWLLNLRRGDLDSLAPLFAHYRPRLEQMLRLRMGAALAVRVDPSDVLQEVYIDAAQQVRRYLGERRVSFYVWLRKLTWERLAKLQRRHLGAQRRGEGYLSGPTQSILNAIPRTSPEATEAAAVQRRSRSGRPICPRRRARF